MTNERVVYQMFLHEIIDNKKHEYRNGVYLKSQSLNILTIYLIL